MVTDDIEFRPIVLPKATMDILLKEDRPDRLIALYIFYYYTAIWQRTNQPKVTTSYVSNALQWKKDTVTKYKQKLIDIGLIKNVKKRDTENRIIGHYIKVKYYVHTLPKGVSGKLEQKRVPKDINQHSSHKKSRYPIRHTLPKGVSGILNAYSNNKQMLTSNPSGLDTERVMTSNEKFYRKCANRLHKRINIANKLKISPGKSSDIKMWHRQFRKLHRDDGADKDRIKTVLNWLCKNYGKRYVPNVFSAISFRDKFLMIENVMRIDKEKRSVKKIKLTKTARIVLKEVDDLSWPKGASSQLPEVVAKSLKNYRAFLKANSELQDKLKKQTRMFASHLEDSLHEPQEYIIQYLTDIHKRIINWESWSGNLSTYIWKVDCDYFKKQCAEISEDYSGDGMLWKQYQKKLHKAV